MSSGSNGNHRGKNAAVSAGSGGAAALTAVLAFWAAEGRDYVTKDEVVSRAEVAALVQTQAPYVEDRKMIERQLAQAEEINARLSEAISNLNTTMAEIGVELRHLRDRD